jgi:hypothetical protein
MSDRVRIDRGAAPRNLALAAATLAGGGTVEVEGLLELRQRGAMLLCDVIDPLPGSQRCEMEYEVLVENARRALEACGLAALLPDIRRRWSVVAGEEPGRPEGVNT